MKKILFALIAILFLLALVAVPPATTYAAADATCASDPSSGPVGTDFVITCWGYTPNSYVWAYLVEPSGAAGELFNTRGNIKTNEQGAMSYTQPSYFPGFLAYPFSFATGTWHFVAEETGLAKAVIHRGEASFSITGGTEGVNGAVLTANPATLYKPLQGTSYIHYPNVLFPYDSWSTLTLSGSGFAPYEMVSIWWAPPHGGCSSMTEHSKWEQGFPSPPYSIELNQSLYFGVGSGSFETVKANAAGEVTMYAYFFSWLCEGEWQFVARGNASGRGAETFVTLIGNPIETNASLAANPGAVSAMYDRVEFHGSGFGSNEHITCWLTTPQGQAMGFPYELAEISFPGFSIHNTQIRSDSGGNISFDMVTGSYYYHTSGTGQFEETILDPVASEGALGVYKMSCRGDVSGATAIAEFTVTGGFVDP